MAAMDGFGHSSLARSESGDDAEPSESARCAEDFEMPESACFHDWDAKVSMKRGSSHGIERTISSVSSLIGSYTAEIDAAMPSEPWLKHRLTEMENKLEVLLQRMADEVSLEVDREQQHLILMQEQVDKQGQMLSRQVTELHKQMERESARNTCMTSLVRESKDALAEKIERQGQELELLRTRLLELESPLHARTLRSVLDFCWSGCFLSPGRLLLSTKAFQAAQGACVSPVRPRLPE